MGKQQQLTPRISRRHASNSSTTAGTATSSSTTPTARTTRTTGRRSRDCARSATPPCAARTWASRSRPGARRCFARCSSSPPSWRTAAASRGCRWRTCTSDPSTQATNRHIGFSKSTPRSHRAQRPSLTPDLSPSTTTQIHPRSLIPAGLHDLPLESKRIDYCIYLSQPRPAASRTQALLAARSADAAAAAAHGVNQAGSSDYVRWLPQLVGVECKRGLAGTDGMVQLGVWMAALRSRLRALARPDGGREAYLMPMPCLRAEGLDWKMYWCYVGEAGDTVSLRFFTLFLSSKSGRAANAAGRSTRSSTARRAWARRRR